MASKEAEAEKSVAAVEVSTPTETTKDELLSTATNGNVLGKPSTTLQTNPKAHYYDQTMAPTRPQKP